MTLQNIFNIARKSIQSQWTTAIFFLIQWGAIVQGVPCRDRRNWD